MSGESGTSSYVPSFSISCSPPLWETNCNIFGKLLQWTAVNFTRTSIFYISFILVDTAYYHVLAGILIVAGIVRAYFGDALKAVGVFIDGFIFGFLLTFYSTYSTDADVSEGIILL